MKFTERLNPKTEVDVLKSRIPTIMVNPIALSKMWTYVDECADEIGWLGTAIKQPDNVYQISDVYLFDQDVHATTTEITVEGLTRFAEEVLVEPNGLEIWNNIKLWGHSHVNMSTSPSKQDDEQMETFSGSGHDWFMRLIANKKGEMVIDIYDFNTSVCFLDLPWEISRSVEEEAIEAQISQLYNQIDQIRSKNLKIEKKWIVDEIKEKVKKKVESYGWKWNKDKKINNKDDLIKHDMDVYEYFGDHELQYFGCCHDISDLENSLIKEGYNGFTKNDIKKIYEVAYKELQDDFMKRGGY